MKIIHQEPFKYTYVSNLYYSSQEIEFSEIYIILDKIKNIIKSDKYEGLWLITMGSQVTTYITKETLDKILANMEVI